MQLDSQRSGIGPDRPAEDFANAISAAENRRELAFAVAAGDVESGHHGHGGDGSSTGPGPPVSVTSVLEEGAEVNDNEAAGHGVAESTDVVEGVPASAAASSTEGRSEQPSAHNGTRQLSLKHWLL